MPRYEQSGEIRKFFTKGQPISTSKGEVILGNDSHPDGIYYIDTGYVKAYSLSDSGDEYLHIIYGQGEIFPLIWAYLGVINSEVYYETMSETVLWRVAREWFMNFIKTNINVCFAMSMQLSQQFRLFSDRVDNLEYKRASDRIIYRLLYLASRFGAKDGNTIMIDAPITHEAFANSINLARESVSREMEKLYEERILERNSTCLRIINIRALYAKLNMPASLEIELKRR